MTEPAARSHQLALGAPTDQPPSLRPYLSSAHAGWDGLVAQAFHVPRAMDGWMGPVDQNISLSLYIGGPLRLEWRAPQGAWTGRTLCSGDLILRPGAGPSYEWRWHSLSSAPTHRLLVFLSQEVIARAVGEVAGADPSCLRLVERVGFRDPLLSQIALALWRELQEPAPAGNLYAHSAAQLLGLHLVRQYASCTAVVRAAPPPPPGLSERQSTQVLEFVRTHLREELSLGRLAQQTGYSPHHFARLLRRTLGASPHQVVLRERLARAQNLLEETDMPLAQVAGACGFANQSSFTRVFTRHLGVTPRAYRRARVI
jgi:AraC family transcriptional regulator